MTKKGQNRAESYETVLLKHKRETRREKEKSVGYKRFCCPLDYQRRNYQALFKVDYIIKGIVSKKQKEKRNTIQEYVNNTPEKRSQNLEMCELKMEIAGKNVISEKVNVSWRKPEQ